MCSFEKSSGKPQGSYVLDDRNLIEWLKSNHKDIAFTAKLAYEVHEYTENLVEAIEKLDSNRDFFRQKDEVSDVWRHLIGKAIVYLKFRDVREKYHDDEDYGVEKLDEFFRTFRDFEPLLYGAREERYRDHMAHMLSVFLVGELLIKDTIGFDKIDVGDECFPENKRISADEKEAMWCIMSLTHDLGIALERVVDISPKAKDMLARFGIIDMQELSYPFVRLPLHDFAIQFISSDLQELPGNDEKRYIPHIQSKYFLKFSEAYERRDHGIISCLVLMRNLVYFLETDYSLDPQRPLHLEDAKQFLIRLNILRAIAAHSNENIYYLTLPQFPFLLTIFDELHEWGRPRLIEMFQRERPYTSVTVEELSENAMRYKIALGSGITLDNDKERMRREILQFFIRKGEKIRRILRSAVGGELRNLKLTLEVRDELEAKAKSYKIIHETPQSVTVLEDDKETTWLDLRDKL